MLRAVVEGCRVWLKLSGVAFGRARCRFRRRRGKGGESLRDLGAGQRRREFEGFRGATYRYSKASTMCASFLLPVNISFPLTERVRLGLEWKQHKKNSKWRDKRAHRGGQKKLNEIK